METSLFPACLLLGAAVSLGITGSQTAQQTPPRPSYGSLVPGGTGRGLHEIHVDERCRILPSPVETGKAKPRRDSVICHLESEHTSSHVEETTVDGVPQRSHVNIEEQEYVLQDITADPVTFVVEQPVSKDWTVDSDPQPTKIIPANAGAKIGATAVFRVNAQPGQIVRLHVGLRHAKMKKQKPAAL
jgi:hypothetical protein